MHIPGPSNVGLGELLPAAAVLFVSRDIKAPLECNAQSVIASPAWSDCDPTHRSSKPVSETEATVLGAEGTEEFWPAALAGKRKRSTCVELHQHTHTGYRLQATAHISEAMYIISVVSAPVPATFESEGNHDLSPRT